VAKSEPVYKIGFVLDGGLERPDGVQQYILRLGEWYKSQGHSVRYIVAGKIAPGIEDAVSLSRNIRVIGNGNRLTIPLPNKRNSLKKFMDDEEFDVLHVQTPYSPLMGEQLIFLSGPEVAIVGTFHILPNAWYFAIGNWLLGRWCHFSLKRFDRMLSVSEAARDFCKKTFGIDSEVMPNVVDYEHFNSAKVYSKYADKLNILFLGRLVPRKGCLTLLKAINVLVHSPEELPEFRVIVCGDGVMRPKLEDYVKKHKLQDYVVFEGFVSEEDKPKYYASADIAVFPSSGGESFGIVLLEAMASFKAVVLAGNNPGYASVLEPKPELLFEANNANKLAEKLHIYLSDPKLRQDINAWEHTYAKEFDTKVIGTKILNVYREALLKRRSL
jgi:phosphatidylinositol alpha-mannosyltransferase